MDEQWLRAQKALAPRTRCEVLLIGTSCRLPELLLSGETGAAT